MYPLCLRRNGQLVLYISLGVTPHELGDIVPQNPPRHVTLLLLLTLSCCTSDGVVHKLLPVRSVLQRCHPQKHKLAAREAGGLGELASCTARWWWRCLTKGPYQAIQIIQPSTSQGSTRDAPSMHLQSTIEWSQGSDNIEKHTQTLCGTAGSWRAVIAAAAVGASIIWASSRATRHQ